MALPGTKRRSTLRPVDHILLALCIGALVAAIVDRLARAGPLSLRYPATVFSNGSPALVPSIATWYSSRPCAEPLPRERPLGWWLRTLRRATPG